VIILCAEHAKFGRISSDTVSQSIMKGGPQTARRKTSGGSMKLPTDSLVGSSSIMPKTHVLLRCSSWRQDGLFVNFAALLQCCSGNFCPYEFAPVPRVCLCLEIKNRMENGRRLLWRLNPTARSLKLSPSNPIRERMAFSAFNR